MKKAAVYTMTAFAVALTFAALVGDISGTLGWGESYACILAAILFAFNAVTVQS